MLDEPTLLPERRRQLTAMAGRAIAQMKRLVSDLLDAVRIQTGRLTLDLERVTIGAIVDQAAEMARPMAAERDIALETAVIDREVRLHVDRARIQQVLGNLLGNALKFTNPHGRVVLEGSIEGGEAVFRVEDTGPGIPEDRLPHLFEQFWQGDSKDRRGVGLGLAICKAIVIAHGGVIDVESTVGQGSIFSVRVPVSNEQPVGTLGEMSEGGEAAGELHG
jgi:signal transduction histidine kinase